MKRGVQCYYAAAKKRGPKTGAIKVLQAEVATLRAQLKAITSAAGPTGGAGAAASFGGAASVSGPSPGSGAWNLSPGDGFHAGSGRGKGNKYVVHQ